MSDLDTQVLDDPQLDPANDGSDPDAAGGAADEPFLKVNDRQVYKTREDVIKSMEEASKLGASFSEIRKVAKKYGIEKLDPGLIDNLFSELVTHRTEKAKAATAKTTSPTDPSAKTTDPEVAKAIEWLKKNAKEAGYVSNDEVEALKKELAELKGGFSNREQEQRDSLIAEGQEAVSGWLKDAKGADGKPITLDDDTRNELEETIATWVNAKEERIAKFYKGGNTSLALVKEGFSKALPLIVPGAVAFPNPAAKVAASGKAKTELINRNPRRLPNDGTPADKGQKRPERIGDPALHNRVKAKLARLLAGDSDE